MVFLLAEKFWLHAFVARHYLDGGNYPTGTSRRIAETVSDLIEKNDGVLAVNAGVDRIKIEKGRAVGVVMENGDIIEAKHIISNAGVVIRIVTFYRNKDPYLLNWRPTRHGHKRR